ncbi:hypothetical protein ElyMa_005161200 [Elysia marginata]|uniref:Uncharacterized protein n=1 Tax=Elysia marginata TaxID=1093978 RepID=A0AAV4JTA1_9GAST|nr:hypothetical protein ElyMa_005161200 [Elysia marginata]
MMSGRRVDESMHSTSSMIHQGVLFAAWWTHWTSGDNVMGGLDGDRGKQQGKHNTERSCFDRLSNNNNNNNDDDDDDDDDDNDDETDGDDKNTVVGG